MLKLAPVALAVILLTGCASDNYKMYADTQKAIANANAMAEAARYQALAEIAKQGDTTAKVVAVMSLNQGGPGAGVRPQQQVNPPEHWGDTALRWASLVLPVTTQLYTVSRNSAVAIRQSDNSTQLGIAQSNNQANVSINTNSAFTSMNAAGLNAANSIASVGLNTANSIASLGFTAVTNVANTGLSTTANVANSGMTSIVNVANNGSNNMTTLGTAFSNSSVSMTNAHSNAIISLSNAIANVQPNITTTTTTTTNNNCGANVSGGTLTCP